jgi:hypothetical protein
MIDEYIEVDKKHVKNLFTGYGIAVLILISLILFVFPILKEGYKNLLPFDQILYFELFTSILLASTVLPAIFIIRTGKLIVKEKQIPSSKMRVLRRTKVIRGDLAIKKGKRFIILGRVTIILIVFSIFSNYYINKKFIENPFSFVNWKEVEKALNP